MRKSFEKILFKFYYYFRIDLRKNVFPSNCFQYVSPVQQVYPWFEVLNRFEADFTAFAYKFNIFPLDNISTCDRDLLAIWAYLYVISAYVSYFLFHNRLWMSNVWPQFKELVANKTGKHRPKTEKRTNIKGI